jgi:hypothetical protein
MEQPLRLIGEARQAFQTVQDYSCVMVKRERIDGKLHPDSIIVVKVRNQPFSVYMRWQEPRSLAGQEVCYVAGRNEGKMRVHPPGLLGAVGFVSLDPTDPRAQQTSRHSITEAGIGNLIDRLTRRWEAERGPNYPQVRVAEYQYNKRRCTRVEMIHAAGPRDPEVHYRGVVYFDQETHLPIRVECYDWPKRPGDPGELIEVYSYINLRLNARLGAEVFNH